MKPLDPRLRRHLAPARYHVAGLVVAGVASGLLIIGQAFAVAALIVALVSDPSGPGWHRPAAMLVLVGLGRAVVTAVGDLTADRAAAVVSSHLRRTVLAAAFDLGARGLSGRRRGELGLLATRGVGAVEPYLTRYLPALVLAAILPILTVVAIISQDLWAGATVVITLPLVPIFAILIGLATKERAEKQYRSLAVLAGHFVDVVRGLPTLVVFNRAAAQLHRIRAVTDRYRRATMETLRLAFVSSGALELIATLSVALVAVNVGLRLAAGTLDLGTALVVLLLAPEAYWPLRRVGAEFHAAAEGVSTFEAIDDLLASVPTTPGSASLTDQAPSGPIHLTDLRLTYPGRTSAALDLPRATITGPGLTAITGPSGCGKSTLLQVLLGELTPDRGAITVGGVPLAPATWREHVAQVPQTPWLTADTIAANLRLGRPGATDDDLWQALDAVDLTDAVRALPESIDTVLGEDGAGLSAGQRARVALARVIVADRPYVILDEPTAHLDAETEAILIRTLARLAKRATVIAVAHSAALVRAADQVITLAPPSAADEPAAPEHSAAPPRLRRAAPAPDVDADVGPRFAALRYAAATLLGTGASLSGIALTATAGWLIVRASEHPPILYLMVAIVGVRTFGLARPVLRYAERLVSHDVALRLLADTRATVYQALIPLVPARLGRRRGDLLTSVVDDVDSHLDRELRVRQPALVWLATTVLVTAVAWWIHPTAGWIVGLVAVLGGSLPAALVWGLARRHEVRFIASRAALSAEVLTTLESARQLVLWGADRAAMHRIDHAAAQMAAATRGTVRGLATAGAFIAVAGGLGVVAVAAVLVAPLQAGLVSGPVAALVVLIPLALADVLVPLPEAAALAVRTKAAQERLTSLSRIPSAVPEPAAPRPSTNDRADLTLTDVWAGWDHPDPALRRSGSGHRGPVLRGIDLHVGSGATLGVIGPSGSGKSTLVAVLLRHLAPWQGRYLLGGDDTAGLGSALVRRRVSLVDDDPYIFGSTVRENVRLAAPSADDSAILDALAQAGLTDWFDALPHGLDTFLGDGGSDVSGGERARLGIARVVLRAPRILVLDEPTAHLDSATARRVRETLLAGPASSGRTVVWITHDEALLSHLDAVLDLSAPQATYARSAA